MTLYVDIIFLENVFMNSIILLATGIILKDKTKIIRNLISSSIGAIYAIIIYTSHIELYSNIFLKIMLSLVIVYISFKPQNTKSMLKHIIIFYLTSFTFGGVAFALLYFIRPQDILFQNGVLTGTYPIKMILAGGIVGFAIVVISFKNINYFAISQHTKIVARRFFNIRRRFSFSNALFKLASLVVQACYLCVKILVLFIHFRQLDILRDYNRKQNNQQACCSHSAKLNKFGKFLLFHFHFSLHAHYSILSKFWQIF